MLWVAGLVLAQSFAFSSGQQADDAVARPDTILTATAADFPGRVSWAEQTARTGRFSSYWLGWAIPGDGSGSRWLYVDRYDRDETRGSGFGGWSVSGSAGGLTFNGIDMPALTGGRDAHDLVVLVRYEILNGRPTPVRVHVGSYAFPLVFDGGALFWLGGASSAENVDRARSTFSVATDDAVRAGLVAVAGATQESASAAPALRTWLDDQRLASSIRREAASWLAYHPYADGFTSLTRVAQNDTSVSLRSTAMRALARSAPPATSVDVLTRLGREDPNSRVRRDAVQVLGTVRDDRAVRALVDIVERPGDTAQAAVRGEAMQVLARQSQRQAEPVPQRVIDLFDRIARTDADSSVQHKAVDALVSLRNDERATRALINLVNTHPNGRVQTRAVQGLARAEPTSEVIRALQRIANDHPRPETQRSAVRSMAMVRDSTVRDILADMAEKHPNAEIRKAALDALVQVHRR